MCHLTFVQNMNTIVLGNIVHICRGGFMKNDVVKYANWLNNLSFNGFGQVDFNLFMYLCAELKDEGTDAKVLDFKDMRKKVGLESHSNARLASDLDRMTTKLLKVTCRIETESEIIKFVLFPTFKIDEDAGTLTVAVNPEFKFVLNSVASQFTQFELREFVELDSRYAKTLYRLLKQFKTTGDRTIKVDEFREKLGVPKSYPNRNVASQIIEPTVATLRNSFPDLKYEVIKASRRGSPVRAYRFSFTPEAPDRQRTIEEWQKDSQPKRQKKPGFNDFEQHEYDFDQLERDLLSANPDYTDGGTEDGEIH